MTKKFPPGLIPAFWTKLNHRQRVAALQEAGLLSPALHEREVTMAALRGRLQAALDESKVTLLRQAIKKALPPPPKGRPRKATPLDEALAALQLCRAAGVLNYSDTDQAWLPALDVGDAMVEGDAVEAALKAGWLAPHSGPGMYFVVVTAAGFEMLEASPVG